MAVNYYDQCMERVKEFYGNLEKTRKIREDFFERGIEPPADSVSRIVLDSWHFCQKNNISPKSIHRRFVAQKEYDTRCEKMRSVIKVIRPIFDTYMLQSGGRVNTLDLYDEDLVFIYTFGGVNATKESRYAVPGVCCDPESAGPTAMSLAKSFGTPQRLIGPEHVDENLQDRVCTAVPIYDGSNKIIGIINIVEKLDVEALRSLGVMSAIAQGISFSLENLRQRREIELTGLMNQQILETVANGIIATDFDGVIRRINRAALRALDIKYQDEIVGRTLDDCFGKDNPLSEFLRSSENSRSVNFSLLFRNRTHHFTGQIWKIDNRRNEGTSLLLTFQDMGTARTLLKNVAGWQANMTFENVMGHSAEMQNVIRIAKQAAELPCNILIQGESGTGKDVFAQAIHNASAFRNGPFVTVNCAAIPHSLIESELFGYEGGAFTGARKDGQPGKFELAQDGTLFLDEINSMPLDMQVKLLRVLQEKKVTRVGGRTPIPLNIRIIAASNEDLLTIVKQERFRMDLYYRLNVVMVEIPPLRRRTEDIEEICRKFLQGRDVFLLSDAVERMKHYSWPGNVRELENVIERAEIQARMEGKAYIDEGIIAKCGVTLDSAGEENEAGSFGGRRGRAGAEREALSGDAGSSRFREEENAPEAPPAGSGGKEQGSFGRRTTSRELVRDRKEQELLSALEENQWNISQTAKQLGMARNTVYNRMRRYGLSE